MRLTWGGRARGILVALAVVLAVAGFWLSRLRSLILGHDYPVRPGWGGGQARRLLVALTAALATTGASTTGGVETAPSAEPLVQGSEPAPPVRRAAGTCVARPSWGVRRDGLARLVVRLVNDHREKAGLQRLRILPSLTRSAIWKARHMARYYYFGHLDPAPPRTRGVPERLAACGFSGGGSENIAFGYETPEEVVTAWLGSPGHRRNIESTSWRYIGVGAAASPYGGTFWTQDFG